MTYEEYIDLLNEMETDKFSHEEYHSLYDKLNEEAKTNLVLKQAIEDYHNILEVSIFDKN